MDFQSLVHNRYACRSYQSRPVEQEKLDRILEAARVAPTAVNLQPQRYLIVRSPEGLEKIDRVTECRFGAPLVLVLCYDKNEIRITDYGYQTSDMDAAISLTHAMLAAEDEGLGSVWVLRFDREKLMRLFDIPQNIVPLALMPMGHRGEGAEPAPKHSIRMPAKDMFFYEKF